jgi:hypothetical protein
MVVCVHAQNLYDGMLAAPTTIDSMPVNLRQKRVQADPTVFAAEAPAFKRVEGELAMEGCNLIIQGTEKNVHIIMRSVVPEPTPDGKGTAYLYTGRVADKKSGEKKEFFRLQRAELVKLTGMQLAVLSGFRPGPGAYVVPDHSKAVKEIHLEAVDKMVDSFMDYVALRADGTDAEVRRVDRHLKGGFDAMNKKLNKVLSEIKTNFEVTNSKLDAGANDTCNDSVFSFAVPAQEELTELRAQVRKLDEQLRDKDLIIKQQADLIALLQAQLAEARKK